MRVRKPVPPSILHKMDSTGPIKKMKRSRSLNSLTDNTRCDSEWDKSDAGDDSGVQSDGFGSLERKVDKLYEICTEQSQALASLVEVLRARAAAGEEGLAGVLAELLQRLAEERENVGDGGARSLLNAIEASPALERRVGDALTQLLQSEDLKQRIVSSTTASIKELVKNLFSVEVSSLYVPIMEKAHRQLLQHVTKLVATAFTDLEENTACSAEALRQTSHSLQAALQRHQVLLQEAFDGSGNLVDAIASTTEKVIERELKQWREEIINVLPQAVAESEGDRAESPVPSAVCASPDEAPASPSDGGLSPVDLMMITAEVTKLIQEGCTNEAFTKALLATELSVVVAACRAAAPALARAALAQPVLLSLLQQLATDLLLDTQLKCSYIEYALSNLNPADPVTRAHLPFVAGELRRHLGGFLHKYPNHVQAHRIAAIIDTALTFQ